MTRWVVVLVTLFSLVISISTFAAQKNSPYHHDCSSPLNLSEDQCKKLQEIRMQVRDSLLPLKIEREKKRLELGELLLNSNPDRQAIDSKLQEIEAVENQEHEQFMDGYFNTLAILTPDQKKAFTRVVVTQLTEGKDGFNYHNHNEEESGHCMKHGNQKMQHHGPGQQPKGMGSEKQ